MKPALNRRAFFFNYFDCFFCTFKTQFSVMQIEKLPRNFPFLSFALIAFGKILVTQISVTFAADMVENFVGFGGQFFF